MCKTCKGLWNRDVNSSLNIHRIAENHRNGAGRPEYLCRSQVQQSVSCVTSTQQNQIIHEVEIP